MVPFTSFFSAESKIRILAKARGAVDKESNILPFTLAFRPAWARVFSETKSEAHVRKNTRRRSIKRLKFFI
jgi:hypothetical protein